MLLTQEQIQEIIAFQEGQLKQSIENQVRNTLQLLVNQEMTAYEPQIKEAAKKYFKEKAEEIIPQTPDWVSNQVDVVIQQRILDFLDRSNASIASLFSTRAWPNESKVISFVDSIIQKQLNIHFDELLKNKIEMYIKRLWVVDIKDMENDLQSMSDQANYAYECWRDWR